MKKNESNQSVRKSGDTHGAKEPVRLLSATITDLYSLVALDEELFDAEVCYDPETFLAYILSQEADVRLALARDELVGCAIVGYDEFADEAEDALLVTINVAAGWQRRGIGSLLLNDAMSLARKRGEKTLALQVATDNPGAKHFYERHGFDVVERLTAYYGERGDAFCMTQVL